MLYQRVYKIVQLSAKQQHFISKIALLLVLCLWEIIHLNKETKLTAACDLITFYCSFHMSLQHLKNY